MLLSRKLPEGYNNHIIKIIRYLINFKLYLSPWISNYEKIKYTLFHYKTLQCICAKINQQIKIIYSIQLGRSLFNALHDSRLSCS